MSKEYLETLGKNIRYKKEYIGNDTYRLYIKKNEIELLENYLEQEQIKNAKPSEALDSLEEIISYYNEPQYELGGGYSYKNELLESCGEEVNTVKQALLKAQEVEKENQKYKQLEEQLGCQLEKFLTVNEIYSDLEDGTIKKYEIIGINFCEKKIYFWMSFVPMSVDFTDYKKYYWLKEDKSE